MTRPPIKPKPGAAEQRRMARLRAALLAEIARQDREGANARRRLARKARREGGKNG